jgi:hypothetical protein
VFDSCTNVTRINSIVSSFAIYSRASLWLLDVRHKERGKEGEGATFSNSCFAVSYSNYPSPLSVHFSLGSMYDQHCVLSSLHVQSYTTLQLTAKERERERERERDELVVARMNLA